MKKVVAIIQARLGSTRLPGKVLKPILKKPMLWHIVNRVKAAKKVDDIVIATTAKKEDQKIVIFCKKNNISYFEGSEKDVLDRFYQAAKKYSAEIVVRITADCPLVDPKVIDAAINKFLKSHFDHLGVATGAGVASRKIKKFPDGLDSEVFWFEVLEKAAKNAKDSQEREHVTMYTWKRPEIFKLGALYSKKDYSTYRFTVDYPEDLKFVQRIYEKLYKTQSNFSLEDVIKLLEKYPALLKINNQFIGKEGYESLHNR